MNGRHLVEIDDDDLDCLLRLAHGDETLGQTAKRLFAAVDYAIAAQVAAEQPPVVPPKPARAGDATIANLRARYRKRYRREWPGGDGPLARLWMEERDRLLPQGTRVDGRNSGAIYGAAVERMRRTDWRNRGAEGVNPREKA